MHVALIAQHNIEYSIQLANGFYRTKEYNIAYYGQTATSIFVTRFLFNAVINFFRL